MAGYNRLGGKSLPFPPVSAPRPPPHDPFGSLRVIVESESLGTIHTSHIHIHFPPSNIYV